MELIFDSTKEVNNFIYTVWSREEWGFVSYMGSSHRIISKIQPLCQSGITYCRIVRPVRVMKKRSVSSWTLTNYERTSCRLKMLDEDGDAHKLLNDWVKVIKVWAFFPFNHDWASVEVVSIWVQRDKRSVYPASHHPAGLPNFWQVIVTWIFIGSTWRSGHLIERAIQWGFQR